MTEKNSPKPWYKKLWIIALLFFFGFIITGLLSNEQNEEKRVPLENKKNETKDYSTDIGKTFCNATNDICDGIITKVQTCANDKNQQCYIVDRGKDYNRQAEHPVSNGYAK